MVTQPDGVVAVLAGGEACELLCSQAASGERTQEPLGVNTLGQAKHSWPRPPSLQDRLYSAGNHRARCHGRLCDGAKHVDDTTALEATAQLNADGAYSPFWVWRAQHRQP